MSTSGLSQNDYSCPVCMENFGLIPTTIPVASSCLHNICNDCFDLLPKLPQKQCPTCRDPIITVKRNDEFLAATITQIYFDMTCSGCDKIFGLPETGIPVAGPCLHNICMDCFDRMPVKNCPCCSESILEARKNCEFLSVITAKIFTQGGLSFAGGSLSSILTIPDLLTRAVAKARVFVRNIWPEESANPCYLTTQEVDVLWDKKRRLTEKVFAKIYGRLSVFYTNECTVSDVYKLRGAKFRYSRLCHLVARPKAVEDCNAIAQFCFAHCLFFGVNTPCDKVRAVEHYQLAADQGLTLATHRLAISYCESYGVKMNAEWAFILFNQASIEGCVEALTEIGKCYLAGNGTAESKEIGIQELKRAVGYGNISAMVTLGDYYSRKEENYLGCEFLDLEMAIFYYTQAISRGSEESIADLHRCQDPDEEPVGNNPTRCVIV